MQPVARIVLLTRFPRAGETKTRLIPALGEEGAARLHRDLVEHTVAEVRQSGLPFELRITGAPIAEFQNWLGPNIAFVEQGNGDLGARLARVPAPALFIGSDAPDLRAAHLCDAAEALTRVPAVIGPAADGGYWLLGIAHAMPHLFTSMPWGTDLVAKITITRLEEHGIVPMLLPTLIDCDRPEDLKNWPELVQ